MVANLSAVNSQINRQDLVPKLVGDHNDWLIVTGLAGTSRDIASLTQDGNHIFTMGGVMGAAVMTGFGLALAQPNRQILVVTGDGELLMNIGALATVAVRNPDNLSILCVDNGHYGETGYQRSHTSLGVDLEIMARGAGIAHTMTVAVDTDAQAAALLLRRRSPAAANAQAPAKSLTGTVFVNAQVDVSEPPSYKRNLDPAECRVRFRTALLGQ